MSVILRIIGASKYTFIIKSAVNVRYQVPCDELMKYHAIKKCEGVEELIQIS
jgi:hypothetical protein